MPLSTVYRWRARGTPRRTVQVCWRCRSKSPTTGQADSYAYLFGQYLGDGHLAVTNRVAVLRIYACHDYPAIQARVADAIADIRGTRPGVVGHAASARLATIQSYWTHWPCLFPQHGPGRKHERAIALADWQEQIIARHPWPFVAGLLHSDGCRAINTVTVRGTTYRYPRWFFANESADILTLLGRALDSVGVRWRYNRANSISIARRESVALVDRHVGAKR